MTVSKFCRENTYSSETWAMNYYLMSAGSLPNQDYRWWQVAEGGGLAPAEPPLIQQLTAPKGRLSDWLDDEGVSILLGQCEELPGLLITSLPTRRCDYQQRPIRNYFGCQATSPDDRLTVRALTASVLADSQVLGEALDRAVTAKVKSMAISSDPGFRFDWQQWESALHEVFRLQIQASTPQNSAKMAKRWGHHLRFRIARDSLSRRKELIDYLLSDALPLPTNLKVILLTTRYKESAFFWSHHGEIGAVLSALEKSDEWLEVDFFRRIKSLLPGFFSIEP